MACNAFPNIMAKNKWAHFQKLGVAYLAIWLLHSATFPTRLAAFIFFFKKVNSFIPPKSIRQHESNKKCDITLQQQTRGPAEPCNCVEFFKACVPIGYMFWQKEHRYFCYFSKLIQFNALEENGWTQQNVLKHVWVQEKYNKAQKGGGKRVFWTIISIICFFNNQMGKQLLESKIGFCSINT